MPHTKGRVAPAAQTGGCPFVPTTWTGFPPQIQQQGDYLYLTTSKSTDMSPASGRIDLDAHTGKAVDGCPPWTVRAPSLTSCNSGSPQLLVRRGS